MEMKSVRIAKAGGNYFTASLIAEFIVCVSYIIRHHQDLLCAATGILLFYSVCFEK